jgi:VWFA-related protein
MFVSLIGLSLLAFQRADFAVQERFRVEYVTLDVRAVDRDGNPVTDLKLSDFEIKENRKRVQPDFFDILDFRQDLMIDELLSGLEARQTKVQQKVRQIIIAMDLEWTKPRDALAAFTQMRDFLKTLPSDVVYRINLYSLERGSITQGFVDTPARVIAYLDEFQERHLARFDRKSPYRPQGGGMLDYGGSKANTLERNRAGESSRIDGDVNDLEDLEDAFRECGQGFIGSQFPDDYPRCISTTLRDYMERMENRARQAIGGLEILTYKFEDNDDLKMIFFVSPGFSYTDLTSANQMANLYITGELFGTPGNFLKGGNFNLKDEFSRVLHACIKNRVIFNSIDIFNGDTGQNRRFTQAHSLNPNVNNQVGTIYNSYKMEIASGIAELAEESGGRFFQSFTLTNPIQKVIDEDRFFYQIGYQSPEGRPGRFRKIKIKVKRKGVKLYYRQGYYGGS